jgi:hypothetical protein
MNKDAAPEKRIVAVSAIHFCGDAYHWRPYQVLISS